MLVFTITIPRDPSEPRGERRPELRFSKQRAETMSPQRTHRPRSGEVVILISIGVLVLALVTGNFRSILDKLYSPYAALIAVIMLVEYVLLKGADRSAMYRRELEAARTKRREDLLTLRKMETKLDEIQADLRRIETESSASDLADHTRAELEELLTELRSRI